MKHLIDKDAVLAEIEKLMNRYDSEYDEDSTEVKAAKGNVCHEILCAINSLEVKEVDLNEEIEKCLKRHNMLAVGKKDFTDIAKHFFELGLIAQKGE